MFKQIGLHDTPSHTHLGASLACTNCCVASAEKMARPYRSSMHTILLHTKRTFDRSGHAPGSLAVSVYEGGALVHQGRKAEYKLCDSWGFLCLCQVVRSPLPIEHTEAEPCFRGGVRVFFFILSLIARSSHFPYSALFE